MNRVLCGFMACGKTTLAKLLSERTGMAVFDTDAWIEEREGMSIARIFGERGEAYFRAIERLAVAEAANRTNTVVATGGGVVLDPENVWRLTTSGRVFYISVPAEILWRRLGGDATRPIAAGFRSVEDVARKLEEREPYYRALPYRIEAVERTPDELVDEIVRA